MNEPTENEKKPTPTAADKTIPGVISHPSNLSGGVSFFEKTCLLLD